MRRPLLWAGAVVAGILGGFFVGRAWDRPQTAAAPAQSPLPHEPGETVAALNRVPRAADTAPPPALAATRAQALPSAPRTAAAAPDPAADSPTTPASAATMPFAPSIDSGVVNSIDAGEVFNKQIARPSTPDQPNQLGDAHRALEREPRDDGWAYSMEAELQNSMISETSMGKFAMEQVECRATLCEVRVSGNGEQADAVRAWSDSLRTNPLNQQLFLNVSSSISSHERVDAIYIFRRPAHKP